MQISQAIAKLREFFDPAQNLEEVTELAEREKNIALALQNEDEVLFIGLYELMKPILSDIVRIQNDIFQFVSRDLATSGERRNGWGLEVCALGILRVWEYRYHARFDPLIPTVHQWWSQRIIAEFGEPLQLLGWLRRKKLSVSGAFAPIEEIISDVHARLTKFRESQREQVNMKEQRLTNLTRFRKQLERALDTAWMHDPGSEN